MCIKINPSNNFIILHLQKKIAKYLYNTTLLQQSVIQKKLEICPKAIFIS